MGSGGEQRPPQAGLRTGLVCTPRGPRGAGSRCAGAAQKAGRRAGPGRVPAGLEGRGEAREQTRQVCPSVALPEPRRRGLWGAHLPPLTPTPGAGQNQGATTRPCNLPPAALSLSLPECQSGPFWSRPGCQLGHARYKTRGPPWVSGWGRGLLRVSMSLILGRAPPGPAGEGSKHRAVGGALGCSFRLEEPVTSVLMLPEVLPSLHP